MSVHSAAYLKILYGSTHATENETTPSKMTLEVIGCNGMVFELKGFSIPLLSPAGAIEVPMPCGAAMYQPLPPNYDFTQLVILIEAVNGALEALKANFIDKKQSFDALVYQGTLEKRGEKIELFNCRVSIDHLEKLKLSGALSFTYFG